MCSCKKAEEEEEISIKAKVVIIFPAFANWRNTHILAAAAQINVLAFAKVLDLLAHEGEAARLISAVLHVVHNVHRLTQLEAQAGVVLPFLHRLVYQLIKGVING